MVQLPAATIVTVTTPNLRTVRAIPLRLRVGKGRAPPLLEVRASDYLRGLMEKVERAATRIANNAGAEITDSFIEYF